MKPSTIFLETSEKTEEYAANLAKDIKPPCVIFLEGELGAGKTTFIKGFLRGLGYTGLVKSPTYTLIETYEVNGKAILHADLYRIKDAHELEEMGFRDYFNEKTIVLIEWPSKALAFLPKPTMICQLDMTADGNGRMIKIQDDHYL